MHRPRFLQRVGWALALRCPNCGARGIFHRWFKMTPNCPVCQLKYERLPGYWLGAMILNFAFTAGAFLIVLGIVLALTWPDVPWTTTWITSMVIGAVTPFAIFPWTRTLFSAMELAVHPLE